MSFDTDPDPADSPADAPDAAEEAPSGQIRVYARSGCAGLAGGVTATIPHTPEVDLLLQDGRLVAVE